VLLLLDTLGLGLGFVLSIYLWHKSGGKTETAVHLLCLGALILFVGGKVLFLLERAQPIRVRYLFGPGYSGIGALILVLGFWLGWSLVSPFRVLRFFDCVTPSAALGLGFARLACYLRGCCGGTVSDVPWSVRFGPDTPIYLDQMAEGLLPFGAPLLLSVHPTQLYEALFTFAVFVPLLASALKRQSGSEIQGRECDGKVFFTGMFLYGTFRFFVEPLRFDYHPWIAHSISTAQVISLGLLVAGVSGLMLPTARHLFDRSR